MRTLLNRWYWSGAAVLAINTARNALRGYRRPRPFSAADPGRAYAYDVEVVDRWAQFTDFAGLDVLELGPGPDLGTGAEMLARGAASYLAVDAYPLARTVDPAFYQRFRTAAGAGLDYLVCPLDAIGQLDRTFDLVVSNACLEHVPDVAGLFSAMRDLLRPGGTMVHLIDAQTHSRPLRTLDPLNIYRFTDRAYTSLARYPGAPNRLLADDYARLARERGFAETGVVERRTLSAAYVRHVAGTLAEPFNSATSVNKMSFYLFAKNSCTRSP